MKLGALLLAPLSFGALLGFMIGMSASPIVSGVVTAAFALVGGVVGLARSKTDEKPAIPLQTADGDTRVAIALFSLGCLTALMLGVTARTGRWFEPNILKRRSELGALGLSQAEANEVLLQHELLYLGLPDDLPIAYRARRARWLHLPAEKVLELILNELAAKTQAATAPAPAPKPVDGLTPVLWSKETRDCCDVLKGAHNLKAVVDALKQTPSCKKLGAFKTLLEEQPAEPERQSLELAVEAACSLVYAL